MTAPVPSITAGRSTSAAPKGTRFPELWDPAWWRIHRHESNVAIGAMLGCSHETVRLARLDMGVAAVSRGRVRGERPARPDIPSAIDGLTQFERKLVDRYRADRRNAPTRDLLVARLRAAHDAHAARDQLAYEDALLAISTAAARIAEHEQQLRRAA